MDRRRFLALLGASAAAIAVPEPVRTYFFGGWAPQPSGLVTLTEEWSSGRHQIAINEQVIAEWVDKRIISRSMAAQFIPEIWNEDVIEAAQWRDSYRYSVDVDTLVPGLLLRAPVRYHEVDAARIFPIWSLGELVEVHERP